MDKKEETPQGCTIMSKKHGQKGGNYMQLYPAIDMKGGKCVRLTQGLFDNVKVYSDTPADMAKLWVEQGATNSLPRSR